MSFSNVIFHGWGRFLAVFNASDHQSLLKSMCDAYRAEMDMVTSCTQHAQQMLYPQFRAELLRIAAEVQANIPWLQEQVLALGGHLPFSSPTPTLERNSWECLRRDMEEAQRGCAHLLEWIHLAEREKPELAVGLQRIRKDKLRHREEFRHMFMKSDPYTISTPRPVQEQEE